MLPLVYSPDYVTPADGLVPDAEFGILRDLLIGDAARMEQFHCQIGSFELITSVHDPAYVQSIFDGSIDRDAVRKIGLPWSEELVSRTRTAVAGTLLTCELALQHGLACNTAGGTHHAHRGWGSGFCIFNDLAVSARTLIDRGQVDHVLVFDLDVHHGDGTAKIFKDDPHVFTFSMHCERISPRAPAIWMC